MSLAVRDKKIKQLEKMKKEKLDELLSRGNKLIKHIKNPMTAVILNKFVINYDKIEQEKADVDLAFKRILRHLTDIKTYNDLDDFEKNIEIHFLKLSIDTLNILYHQRIVLRKLMI